MILYFLIIFKNFSILIFKLFELMPNPKATCLKVLCSSAILRSRILPVYEISFVHHKNPNREIEGSESHLQSTKLVSSIGISPRVSICFKYWNTDKTFSRNRNNKIKNRPCCFYCNKKCIFTYSFEVKKLIQEHVKDVSLYEDNMSIFKEKCEIALK